MNLIKLNIGPFDNSLVTILFHLYPFTTLLLPLARLLSQFIIQFRMLPSLECSFTNIVRMCHKICAKTTKGNPERWPVFISLRFIVISLRAIITFAVHCFGICGQPIQFKHCWLLSMFNITRFITFFSVHYQASLLWPFLFILSL